MKNQSLHEIMQAEDPQWLNTITEASDVLVLRQKLSKTRNKNRIAIIKARIENLTYLAV